jgi:hypothetical protein
MLSSSSSSKTVVENVKDVLDLYLSPSSLESLFREFHRKIIRQYSARIFRGKAPLAVLESCSFYILPEIPDDIMTNDKYRNSYVWKINKDTAAAKKNTFDYLINQLFYQMQVVEPDNQVEELSFDLPNISDTTVNFRLRLDDLIAELFNGKMPIFIRLDGTCEDVLAREEKSLTDVDNAIDENRGRNNSILSNKIFNEFVQYFREIIIYTPRLSFDKLSGLVLLLKPETLRKWITEPTGHSPIMANTIAKTIAYYRQNDQRDALRAMNESTSGNPSSLIDAIHATVKLQAHAAVLDITIRQFINTLLALPLLLEDLNVQANRIRDKIEEISRRASHSKNKDEAGLELQRYKQNHMLILLKIEDVENLRLRVNAAFFIKTHLPVHFKDPVLDRAGLDFRKELLKLVKNYFELGISKADEEKYLDRIYQALHLDKKALIKRQRESIAATAKKIVSANKNKNDNFSYALSSWGQVHRLESMTDKIIKAVAVNKDLFAEILKDISWTNELIGKLFYFMFPRSKFAITGHELKIAAHDSKKLKWLVNGELPETISTADKSSKISNPYQSFMDVFTDSNVLAITDIRRICMAASNPPSVSTLANKSSVSISSRDKSDASSSSSSSSSAQSLPISEMTSRSKPIIFHQAMQSKPSISLFSMNSLTSEAEEDLFEDEQEYEKKISTISSNESSVAATPQHFTRVQHKDIFAMLTSSAVIKFRGAEQGGLALAELYNKARDKKFLDGLTELITKFNLTQQMLEKISTMIKAIIVINQLMKFPNLIKSITNIILNLQGRYIAHYFLNIIHGSNISLYEYILLTAKIPGLCVERTSKKEGSAVLLIEISNLLGSARDVLVNNQNNMPVIDALKGMVSHLAEHAGWTRDELAAADNFVNHGLQFIINECLTTMAEVNSKNNKINYAMKCIDNFADAKGDLAIIAGVENIAAMRRSLWLPDERFGGSHLSQKAFNENSKAVSSSSSSYKAQSRLFSAVQNEKTRNSGKFYNHTLKQEVFDGMIEYLNELHDNGQLLPEKLNTFSLIMNEIEVHDKRGLLEIERKMLNQEMNVAKMS